MTRKLTSGLIAFAASALVSACVSIPGVTTPIPKQTPEQYKQMCDGLRTSAELRTGATGDQEARRQQSIDIMKAQGCPDIPAS